MLPFVITKGTVLLSRLGVTTRSMSAQAHIKISETIKDNVDLNRFEMQVAEDVAFIQYDLSNKTYDLVESVVPEQYSGRGLGKLLAQKTFDHIISQNGKMKLSCDFLQHFYEQNRSKYQGHIV